MCTAYSKKAKLLLVLSELDVTVHSVNVCSEGLHLLGFHFDPCVIHIRTKPVSQCCCSEGVQGSAFYFFHVATMGHTGEPMSVKNPVALETYTNCKYNCCSVFIFKYFVNIYSIWQVFSTASLIHFFSEAEANDVLKEDEGPFPSIRQINL